MSYITKTNLTLNAFFGSQITQFAGLYAVSRHLGIEIKIFREYINTIWDNKCYPIQLFNAFELDHYLCSTEDVQPIDKTYNLQNTIKDDDVFKLDSNFNWDIQGYFHTYHYWHEYRNDLIKILNFKKEITELAKKNIELIKGSDQIPIISLHVRRGDYLQLSSLNLSLNYFKKSISIFSTLFEKFKIVVFSDDISWCKDNIISEHIYFSENNSNHVDMCMMTMCDHNIIANSSFSFWGAYLNQHQNKIVICPKMYIGLSDQIHQFINYNWYLKEWISLDII
jgi:hypothetical protein